MMKTFNLSLSGLCSAAFFLAACGDDVTKVSNVTNEVTGIEVVASADSLGKCTADRSGEMMFAQKENAVYVCVDSAWKNVSPAGKDGVDGADGAKGEDGKDGENGKDGSSCVVSQLPNSSGYKVVCGGDSVGVIFNGKDGLDGKDGIDGADGAKGEDGKNGENGKDGAGCSLTDNGDGSITQVCGEDSVTLYKAFCGKNPYDPEKSLCDHRDRQVYRTVQIGGQTWMAENLNYAYEASTAKSFCYGDSKDSCDKYGRLYMWSAAMDSAGVFGESGKLCGDGVACSPSAVVRGVCPEGFHLPDTSEWNALEAFVQENNGGESVALSLRSQSWVKNDMAGLDIFRFNALPAGNRNKDDEFIRAGGYAIFWTATTVDGATNGSFCRYLKNGDVDLLRDTPLKKNAFSIRCVRD